MIDAIMLGLMGSILVFGMIIFLKDNAEEHIFTMLLLMLSLMVVSAVGGITIGIS